MILRELFSNSPIIPKVSSKSSPGNKYYEFKIDDRYYQVSIKTRWRENDKLYIIDFYYLGTTDDIIPHWMTQDSTGFRTDTYKVLGAVIHAVRDFFSNSKMGYYDLIRIEPNSGSKEKLYRWFTQKLATDLGMKWRYNRESMWYEISGSFEEE